MGFDFFGAILNLFFTFGFGAFNGSTLPIGGSILPIGSSTLPIG